MLNPRQKRFCELYHLSGNATQSYVEAYGTNEESARRLGSLLLTNLDVMEAIGKLEAGSEVYSELKREDIITRLCETITAKPSDASMENELCELRMTKMGPVALFPDKLGAMKELSRMLGYLKPQEVNLNASDELLQAMRRLTGAKEDKK